MRHLIVNFKFEMSADVRQERIRAAFLKTLDRSIDAISGSVLAEAFDEELTRVLGNSLHAEFITTFGTAKRSIEVQRSEPNIPRADISLGSVR